ncbi:MAG: DinB family protein [Acidobacteria bacterium]|nr:DinB family protein [Acidobacteriota bacterium]
MNRRCFNSAMAANVITVSGTAAAPEGTPENWPALWKVSREFTLAVADAMPAEEYGFVPAEGEMSFAALMIHIATAQAFRFAQMAGDQMPLTVPRTMAKADAKAVARKLLEESFEYCQSRAGRLTQAQLAASYKVDWYERPSVSGDRLMLAMFAHTAHHRGQAEVYLRLKGIKPPAYRF